MTWHPNAEQMADYQASSISDLAARALEVHVTTCAPCRSQIAQPNDFELHASWDRVVARVAAPRRSPVERLAQLLGVRQDLAQLVGAASRTVRASWLASVVVCVVLAIVASRGGVGQRLLFLTIAPLAPVAAVATTHIKLLDPAEALVRATPLSPAVLTMARSFGASVPAIALALLVDIGGSGPGRPGAWLLPSLLLTGIALTASTRLSPAAAAALASATWATILFASWLATEGRIDAAFGPVAQLLYGSMCIALGVGFWLWRGHELRDRRCV